MSVKDSNYKALADVGKTSTDFARLASTDKITAKRILSGREKPTDYQRFIFNEITSVDLQEPTEEE